MEVNLGAVGGHVMKVVVGQRQGHSFWVSFLLVTGAFVTLYKVLGIVKAKR